MKVNSSKFILVGSVENQNEFYSQCITNYDVLHRTLGQDFLVTYFEDQPIQLWDILSSDFKFESSLRVKLQETKAVILLTPIPEKINLPLLKTFVNEQICFEYDLKVSQFTPQEFLQKVYLRIQQPKLPVVDTNVDFFANQKQKVSKVGMFGAKLMAKISKPSPDTPNDKILKDTRFTL